MCTGAPVDRNMSEAPLSIINFRKYPMSMAVPQRMVIEKKQDRGQTRVALQCRDPRPTISPRPNGDLMARSLMKIHRLVPILVMALAAGCATTPPPTGLLDQANARIRAADAAGAATRAPGDFAEAQRRFAFAQAALADGDNEQAAASAEEAAAAAETARARAHPAGGLATCQRRLFRRIAADPTGGPRDGRTGTGQFGHAANVRRFGCVSAQRFQRPR